MTTSPLPTDLLRRGGAPSVATGTTPHLVHDTGCRAFR